MSDQAADFEGFAALVERARAAVGWSQEDLWLECFAVAGRPRSGAFYDKLRGKTEFSAVELAIVSDILNAELQRQDKRSMLPDLPHPYRGGRRGDRLTVHEGGRAKAEGGKKRESRAAGRSHNSTSKVMAPDLLNSLSVAA